MLNPSDLNAVARLVMVAERCPGILDDPERFDEVRATVSDVTVDERVGLDGKGVMRRLRNAQTRPLRPRPF
jgi:hypothetical protein